MIIDKGVHMKRLFALLIVAAFCISIFAVPISAVCPNPNDLRFIRSDTPYGDEGGWVQPSTIPEDDSRFASFRDLASYYRIFLTGKIVVLTAIKIHSRNNDITDIKSNSRDRRASSE